MAAPREPKASADDGTDLPIDLIDESAAAPGGNPQTVPEGPDNALQAKEDPVVIEMQSAPAESPQWIAAEARMAELASRLAAAERALAAVPAPEEPRRGSPLPGIAGGLIAAALGFGAAQIVPQGWPIGDNSALRATLVTQGEQIEKLAADVAAIPAPSAPPVVDLSPVQSDIGKLAERVAAAEAALAALPPPSDPAPGIAALEGRIAKLEAAPPPAADPAVLAGLDERLKALEALPPGTVIQGTGSADPAATAALQREISALKSEVTAHVEAARAASDGVVAQLRAETEALKGDLAAQEEAAKAALGEVAAAAESARAALADAQAQASQLRDAAADGAARAAMGRMVAALETGAPFATAVQDLTAAGQAVPAILADNAAGVPTLAALQDSFPDAARAALEAALTAGMGDSATERITTFLRTQVGIRSLEPREGTDPDAVLSRAEAALDAGDLDTALSEISALPEAGQAAMAGWLAQANLRRDALAALATLSATVEEG